jgi:hypothetical protein
MSPWGYQFKKICLPHVNGSGLPHYCQQPPTMATAPWAPPPISRAGSREFLIRLARQVEVGEDAMDVRCYDLARQANVGFVELVITGDAKE